MALHQQATQYCPALLLLVLHAFCHEFVQRSAVGLNLFRRHFVPLLESMQFEHAVFARFVELLRRRIVPGWVQREQHRQELFDALRCDTSTECPSTHTDSDTDSL